MHPWDVMTLMQCQLVVICLEMLPVLVQAVVIESELSLEWTGRRLSWRLTTGQMTWPVLLLLMVG